MENTITLREAGISDVLTPKKVVEELNKYIISQDDAKKNVAIAMRNRYRRKFVADDKMREDIIPKNIILIGPTGVGKTEIARRLAKIANAPFIKVEATKYTEVGYVGKDVESMIKDLVELTFRMVKEEKIEKMKEKYKDEICGKIAKQIVPFDSFSEHEKERILIDIKLGKYDNHEIEVDLKKQIPLTPVIEVYSNGEPPEEMGNSFHDFMGDIMKGLSGQGKKKSKTMKVKAAIDYMIKEEIEEKLDRDDLIPEVLEKVEQDGIVFLDEIDKIAEREGSSRGEVSRQGVQRDILPIVEGTTVMTKYGPVKTDHILFIAAGAFSVAKPSDLMPELQGRFPVRVVLKSLTKEDFIKILTEVDNNLIKQYQKMLEVDNVKLTMTLDAIEEIASYAIEMNEKVENIGARRLATILEEVLKDIMFEAPYEESKEICIDRNIVTEKLKTKIKKENLNNYIL